MSSKYGLLTAYFPLGNEKYDSEELAKAYVEGGVDVLEIGIPVEDPYLDGEVIKISMEKARAKHSDLDWYLQEIKKMRAACPDTILEVFTYKETYSEMGLNAFVKKIESVGVDYALITDMTDEEFSDYYLKDKNTFPLLKFLPFNASDEYVETLKKIPFGGYIFLQATDGKTGARKDLHPQLHEKIQRAKREFTQPVCTGFGISTPEHSKKMTEMGADGVIIGSTVVKYVMEHSLPEITAMLREYKESLKKNM